jgi:cytidylate kinase
MSQKEKLIIAIDGPAGAGKSTVAKLLAKRYSLLYIDSGAMYRAIAWKALHEHVDIMNEQELAGMAADMHIDLLPSDEGTRVIADGKDITGVIREPVITDISSKIATFARIRELLVARQQQIGRTRGVVMEGRDIGSVVFPDAPLKFYLDASIRERAIRRKKDLERAGHQVDLAHLEQQISERDRRDMMREIGPLRKVDDAIIIDTSTLSIEEVVRSVSAHVDAFLQKAVKQ